MAEQHQPASVTSLSAARKRTQAKIAERVDELEGREALHITTMQAVQKAIADGFTIIHGDLAAIRKQIGSEDTDSYGRPIGSGLVGRIMRQEHNQSKMDGWVKWGSGAAAILVFVVLPLFGFIWWLVQNRVEFLR